MTILIFGASGSAGSCVLRVCLAAAAVTEVRAVVRRPLELSDVPHDRIRSIIHVDYYDYASIDSAFIGVDACFYCLGISVNQVAGEAEYRRITQDFAVAAARALRARSPGAGFHFISGRGAGLKSPFMWARVKAETEADLMSLIGAVCYRPGAIDGRPSASEPRLYRAVRPVFRLLRPFRSLYVKGDDIGRAMLQATVERRRHEIIENAVIRDLAQRWSSSLAVPTPEGDAS